MVDCIVKNTNSTEEEVVSFLLIVLFPNMRILLFLSVLDRALLKEKPRNRWILLVLGPCYKSPISAMEMQGFISTI
jgi:hypothetical protein